MALATHLAALQEKHSKLEAIVAAELAHPSPDMNLVQTIKKQKLALKEEIASLRQQCLEAA